MQFIDKDWWLKLRILLAVYSYVQSQTFHYFLFLNENILLFYSIRVHKENQGLQDFLVLMGLL